MERRNAITYVPGGLLLGTLAEGLQPCSPNPDPISDQKNVIFHTRLQTRSLKSIPVFRLGLKAVIMWLSLLRLERKQNSSSNPFRFRIFLCLSYSIGMETINFSYVYVHISLKTHTRFQTKMGTVYTRFQTKTGQKPYPIDGAAHTYIAYLRDYPHRPM